MLLPTSESQLFFFFFLFSGTNFIRCHVIFLYHSSDSDVLQPMFSPPSIEFVPFHYQTVKHTLGV